MKRIAVIPYGLGIGDMVNMRPLLEAVMRSYPGASVECLCLPHNYSLLPPGVKLLGTLNGVHLWKRPAPDSAIAALLQHCSPRITSPVVRFLPRSGMGVLLRKTLKRRGYGGIIDLLTPFSKLDLDTLWTPGPWSENQRHVIDYMADVLSDMSVEVPEKSRQPCIAWTRVAYLPSRTVVLNPHSGSTLKEAPLEIWQAVARHVLARGAHCVVLENRERPLARRLKSLVPEVRLVSTPRISTLIALLGSADVVVSPDTGALHLAAALGVRYVGLFGSTAPAFLGPYHAPKCSIVMSCGHHAPVCRGCWTAQLLPRAACALGHKVSCLDTIEASDVTAKVDKHLLALRQIEVTKAPLKYREPE